MIVHFAVVIIRLALVLIQFVFALVRIGHRRRDVLLVVITVLCRVPVP